VLISMINSRHYAELKIENLLKLSGNRLDDNWIIPLNDALRVSSYVRAELGTSLTAHEDPHRAPPGKKRHGGGTHGTRGRRNCLKFSQNILGRTPEFLRNAPSVGQEAIAPNDAKSPSHSSAAG
jgi:hypothetical protein